jgi:hypothetical protein
MQKKGSILKTKLYRKNDGKIIAGVCAGLAEALNIDVTIVRIIFAFACVYWQFFNPDLSFTGIDLARKVKCHHATGNRS